MAARSRIPAPIVSPDFEALPDQVVRVVEVLAESGRTRKQRIASAAGIPSERAVRLAIEAARRAGVPIVSTSGAAGYELTLDPEQIDAAAEEMRHRAESTLEVVAAFRRTAARLRALRDEGARAPVQGRFDLSGVA